MVSATMNVELDWWPHPLTSEGRQRLQVAPGRLSDVVGPLIPADHRAIAIVDGVAVAQPLWFSTEVSPGQVVQARVLTSGGASEDKNLRRDLLQLGLFVGANVLFPGSGFLVQSFIVVGSGLIANRIFPDWIPGGDEDDAGPFSITGGSNRARPNEPLTLVLGQHRVFADLVAREYTDFDTDGNSYLNQIFDFGLGDLQVRNERIGETPLTSFQSVESQKNVDVVTLVAGNVDTLAGAELEYNVGFERTTAVDTVQLAFDVGVTHFIRDDKGALDGQVTTIQFAWKLAGSTDVYTTKDVGISTPDGPEARNATRRSFVYPVAAAAYDTRVTLLTQDDGTNDRLTLVAVVAAVRAFQKDTADFKGRHAYALRILADGQLYGRVDSFNADVAQLIPVWDGVVWSPKQATSNPAWIYRQFLLGWRVGGKLVAGLGLTEADIDDDSIKAWGAFCDAQGLGCDLVLQDSRDADQIMTLIARCGWGSRDQSTGKEGVLWEDAGRPVSALITPANIVADTFGSSWENEGLADEVVGTYVDRDSGYEENSLRRSVPGIGVPERPATVRLEGVTRGAQAAKEINRMSAGQFYHQRVLYWEMPQDEAFAIQRGDVVGLSHDLVDSGTVGGRLLKIDAVRTGVTLSAPIGAAALMWVWALDGEVHPYDVTALAYPATEVTLSAALPQPPVGVQDDPLSYRFMAFDSTATVAKVRIAGMSPAGDRMRLSARDEIPEYYSARVRDLTHTFLPARGQGIGVGVGVFRVETLPSGIRRFTWSKHPFAEVVGYEIRYGLPGTAYEAMTALHSGQVLASPWESLEEPAAGSWRFAIAGVTADGRYTVPTYYTTDLANPFIEGGPSGLAVESVFASTDTSALAAEQVPLNTWPYRTPATVGGVQWHVEAPAMGTLPNLWKAERVVTGAPSIGTTPSENWGDWSTPGIVRGSDAERAVSGWFRVAVTAAQETEIVAIGSVLSGTIATLATDATPGSMPRFGDIVTFYRTASNFSSTWGYGTDWRKLAPFIGAELAVFGSLSALNIKVRDIDVEGVISAVHISSDVRNVRRLWTGTKLRQNNGNVFSFPMNEDISTFDYLTGVARNHHDTDGGWAEWSIPVSAIPVGSGAGGATQPVADAPETVATMVSASGGSGDIAFELWHSTDGLTLYAVRRNAASFEETTFTAIYGVGDPGMAGGGTITPPPPTAVAPSVPQNVSAIPLTGDLIRFSWTAPDTGSAPVTYRVQRSADGTTWADIDANQPQSAFFYNDSGLVAGTRYYYRVRAENDTGNSDYVTVDTTTNVVSSVPRDFTATATGPSTIYLSWTAPLTGDPPPRYRLRRRAGTSGAFVAIQARLTGLFYNDTGLSSGVTYEYELRAENSEGNSDVVTDSATTSAAVTTSAPSAPGSFSATASGTRVTLSWNASALGTPPITYRLQWSEDNSEWRDLRYSAATSYTHTGRSPGDRYYYRVRGENTHGNSDYAADNVTVPGPPPTDTENIYRTSVNNPGAPSGGTRDENHTPTDWSRTRPDPTATQGVWRSRRTRTFTSTVDRSFISATSWGNPVEVDEPEGAGPVVTEDKDHVYQRSVTKPTRAPTGGQNTEFHQPSLWFRSEPEPTNTESVWSVERTRTFSDGTFSSATAWGNIQLEEGPVPIPVPGALGSFSATSTGRTGIRVSWTAPAGVITSYLIEQRVSGGRYATVYSGGATAYTASGLTPGTTYEFRGRAIGLGGTGPSSTTDATTDAPLLVDPGDPTGFSVTAGASSFAGSWSAPSQSTGAVTYRYGYRKSGTSSWSNRTTSSTSFTLSHTNLTGGDDYDFRVRTEDDAGESGYVTDTATVPLTAPGPVGNLSASFDSDDGVSVTWDAPDSGGPVDSYRATLVSPPAFLDTRQRSASFNLFDPGRYTFRVYATNSVGQGPTRSVSLTIR